MRQLFWGSALFIAYVYVGYPVLLMLWARAARLAAPGRQRATADHQVSDSSGLPSVSIILAVRNEARRLPARIENLLALDYPKDCTQIIVVSDGSRDNPASSLGRFGDRVRLVEVPPAGKAVALNAGAACA